MSPKKPSKPAKSPKVPKGSNDGINRNDVLKPFVPTGGAQGLPTNVSRKNNC